MRARALLLASAFSLPPSLSPAASLLCFRLYASVTAISPCLSDERSGFLQLSLRVRFLVLLLESFLVQDLVRRPGLVASRLCSCLTFSFFKVSCHSKD